MTKASSRSAFTLALSLIFSAAVGGAALVTADSWMPQLRDRRAYHRRMQRRLEKCEKVPQCAERLEKKRRGQDDLYHGD